MGIKGQKNEREPARESGKNEWNSSTKGGHTSTEGSRSSTSSIFSNTPHHRPRPIEPTPFNSPETFHMFYEPTPRTFYSHDQIFGSTWPTPASSRVPSNETPPPNVITVLGQPFNEYNTGSWNSGIQPQSGFSLVSTGTQPLEPIVFPSQITYQGLPFKESCRAIPERTTPGFLMLSELPYGVTRQEVIGYLNKFASPLPDSWCIHFSVDRQTMRTAGCFAEYPSIAAAEIAMDRYAEGKADHKQRKIQGRNIHVSLSSCEAVMTNIFPRAKQVTWMGLDPWFDQDEGASNPVNFFTKEELYLFGKHAELPNKSHFAAKSPQRTYEAFISLLTKFPWVAVDLYTLEMRDQLFETARTMIRILLRTVNNPDGNIELGQVLLQQLLEASFAAEGFSESQKTQLWDAAEIGERLGFSAAKYVNDDWIFETLSPKLDFGSHSLEAHLHLLRIYAETQISPEELSQYMSNGVYNSRFGAFRIIFPVNKPTMTFAEAAEVEWNEVEKALYRAIKLV